MQLRVSCFERWTVTGDHNSYLFSWSFRTFPKCDVFVFFHFGDLEFFSFFGTFQFMNLFFFWACVFFFKEVIKRWESVRRSVWRRLTAGWKGHFQKDKKLGVGYFTSVLFPGISANDTMLMWGLFQKWRTTCTFFRKDRCQSRNKKSTWQVNIKNLDQIHTSQFAENKPHGLASFSSQVSSSTHPNSL